jgi:hypothetical protein
LRVPELQKVNDPHPVASHARVMPDAVPHDQEIDSVARTKGVTTELLLFVISLSSIGTHTCPKLASIYALFCRK